MSKLPLVSPLLRGVKPPRRRMSIASARRRVVIEVSQALDASAGGAHLLACDPGVGKTWAATSAVLHRQRAEASALVVWVARDRKAAEAVRQFLAVPPDGGPGVDVALYIGRNRWNPSGYGTPKRFGAWPIHGPTLGVTTCRNPDALSMTNAGLRPVGICGQTCEHLRQCKGDEWGYLGGRMRTAAILREGVGVIVVTAASEAALYRAVKEAGAVVDLVIHDESSFPPRLALTAAHLAGPLPAGALSLQELAESFLPGLPERAALEDLIAQLGAALQAAGAGYAAATRAAKRAPARRARRRLRRREAAVLLQGGGGSSIDPEAARAVARWGWRAWLADLVDVEQLRRVAAVAAPILTLATEEGSAPYDLAAFVGLLANGDSPIGALASRDAGPSLWTLRPPPAIPDGARLLVLDATGDKDELADLTGRPVREVPLRVAPHDGVRAVLVDAGIHQASRRDEDPGPWLRRLLLASEVRAELEAVRAGRVALGEALPLPAIIFAPQESLRRWPVAWAALVEGLAAIGFDAELQHWRSTSERGTNDYQGAALTMTFATPYMNRGALAERRACRAWWAAKRAGRTPERLEKVKLASASLEALGSALQGHGRCRSWADLAERPYLHLSVGPEHLAMLLDVVNDGRGVHLGKLPGASLAQESPAGARVRASFEGFSAAIEQLQLQAIGVEMLAAVDLPPGARPSSKAIARRWIRKYATGRGWRAWPFPRPGGRTQITIWAATRADAGEVL